ncbi:MAG: hypothetical protein OXD43_13345 [Bacteroidetes bacterium]|nr:hypothetical protein [Bacteroidota bacterium]
MGKTERKLKQAAEMLLSMDEGDKKRPSRPSKKDANRRFKAEIQDGRFVIKEVA